MPLARLIATRIAALNKALGAASKASGAILVDLAAHPVATDPRLWSEDRIHANAAGLARIAEALAHALGLPGSTDAWQAPLVPPWVPTRRQRWTAEARWVGRYLLPWLWEGWRGRSSADVRGAKRPELGPV
jgi:hypothetical protein